MIAQGCASDAEAIARNIFIITGRSGLPSSPTETLSSETVLTNWATLDPQFKHRSSAAPVTNATRGNVPTQIVEALLMGDRSQRTGDPYNFCTQYYTQ